MILLECGVLAEVMKWFFKMCIQHTSEVYKNVIKNNTDEGNNLKYTHTHIHTEYIYIYSKLIF